MPIDCAHYKARGRQREDPMSIAEAGVLAAERDGFVWLGIHEPTEPEMSEVATHFPIHELAIEEAREIHQRAKIEDYDNHYFVPGRATVGVELVVRASGLKAAGAIGLSVG
jgi:magnesium transporter